MRSSLLAALIVLAAAAWTHAQPAIPTALAPHLDLAQEKVVARVDVPDTARRVGQVRVVHRGEADVVETVLYTKLLRRVVAEIRKKEEPNWPEGHAQRADSLRYLEALEKAQQELWAKTPRLDRNADQRQKLLIEFVLAPGEAAVVLSEHQMRGDGENLKITSRRPIAVLELSRAYVARNMRLIVEDSFKDPAAALAALRHAGG